MIGIEVVSHDGPARLGRFTFGDLTISTPSACHLSGEQDGVRFFEVGEDSGIRLAIPPRFGVARRADWGSFRGISEDSMIKSSYIGEDRGGGRADCLVMAADLDLPKEVQTRCLVLAEPTAGRLRDTIERLIQLRRVASPNAAIMIPRAKVWDFPLLALAGADFFSDSHAVECTLSGRMLFESYTLPADGAPEPTCLCPHCSNGGERDADALGRHNRWVVDKVISEIRNRIRIGELKHLTEERAVSHPETMASLKDLLRNHMAYLEEYTTVRPGVEP